MIRYRFIILSPGLKPLRTFSNSKAISDFLRDRDQHSYIEIQAYDDIEPDQPRAWTALDHFRPADGLTQRHDMLYELIEAYGTKLDELAETELRAKIQHADEIRFHRDYQIYLLYRDRELFHRQRDCQILQTAIASDFRKVASRHWKRLNLQLFPAYEIEATP